MPEHLTNPPIAPENDSAFTNLLNTRRAGEEAIKLVKATAAGQRMNFHFFSFLPSAQEIESVRTHSREKTAEFVSQQLKWITVWNHATHFRELSRPEISAGGAYNLGIAHPNLRLSDQDLFRQDDQFLEKIREASLTLNKYAYILLTTFFGNDFSLIGQHLHDGEAAL
ncbi:hypothetical protein KGQ71_04900, partial [Patescibacteria group bacterium]|nr:hypothetical protein [Patescibacteria group bacterium]